MNKKPMLNLYPDSLDNNLEGLVKLLNREEFKDTFKSLYILPSLYHSDLDRGFSVIDYGLNEALASIKDLEALKDMGLDLKLDIVLNHLSTQSPQFKDLIENGKESKYKDFFIDWNEFWDGYGEMSEEGYIIPKEEYIKDMFFRKPGLPILTVEFKDGTKAPYWNTFYQAIETNDKGEKVYLGQMDLNIKEDIVWDYYDETLKTLKDYGASIIRLDAFAYAPKEVGKRNFLNDPETWELLNDVQSVAYKYSLTLLPEIHATYAEGIYKVLADKGYLVYDFFLPGLILYTLEKKDATKLALWANEIIDNHMHTVNMLGCHDGIPLLDLKGILKDEEIDELIEVLKSRGGYVKDLHGEKKMYYQVNMTYYSALNEDDKKLLLARAIQLFMPGKPQIWYLDLFAGKNDYEAVERAGEGGHKEINRTNLSLEDINNGLNKDVVLKQLDLIRFRNTHKAFEEGADIEVITKDNMLEISWTNKEAKAKLIANLSDYTFEIIDK